MILKIGDINSDEKKMDKKLEEVMGYSLMSDIKGSIHVGSRGFSFKTRSRFMSTAFKFVVDVLEQEIRHEIGEELLSIPGSGTPGPNITPTERENISLLFGGVNLDS